MDKLLFWLTDAIGASLVTGLAAALVWGVLSVLLSPCHLGTVPLVVGVVGSTVAARTKRGRGALVAFSFAVGMFVAMAALGVLVATVGFAMQRFSAATSYVVAAIFVVAGLNLVGILPLSLPAMNVKVGSRRGAIAAAVIGFVFGLGLSPCTFAFLAPIIGLSFGTSGATPVRGIALLLAFGVGHCGVVGLAGSSTELVQRYLDWNANSRALVVLKSVCGLLVFCAAALLVYKA